MTEKRILIVEDEQDIADLIRFNLERAGFQALVLLEGRHLLTHVRQFKPDLILLDLMLPDVDGLDLCRRLRLDPALAVIPVVMVTAKGSETDRIVGLELGADDYIVKPFSPRELVLRIKAVISRVYPEKETNAREHLHKGPIEIDVPKHTVRVQGDAVNLTATEFRLLHELMSKPGKVRTREALLRQVWGYSFDGYARTVDTHVRRLRKKLGHGAELLETVRGVGYRFKDDL